MFLSKLLLMVFSSCLFLAGRAYSAPSSHPREVMCTTTFKAPNGSIKVADIKINYEKGYFETQGLQEKFIDQADLVGIDIEPAVNEFLACQLENTKCIDNLVLAPSPAQDARQRMMIFALNLVAIIKKGDPQNFQANYKLNFSQVKSGRFYISRKINANFYAGIVEFFDQDGNSIATFLLNAPIVAQCL